MPCRHRRWNDNRRMRRCECQSALYGSICTDESITQANYTFKVPEQGLQKAGRSGLARRLQHASQCTKPFTKHWIIETLHRGYIQLISNLKQVVTNISRRYMLDQISDIAAELHVKTSTDLFDTRRRITEYARKIWWQCVALQSMWKSVWDGLAALYKNRVTKTHCRWRYGPAHCPGQRLKLRFH
jgi:hypothetical protein